jgi:hypothetical protein
MPNLALVCFIVAVAALLLFLHKHAQDVQRDTLIQDTLSVEQTLRTQIELNQQHLDALAREHVRGELPEAAFHTRGANWTRDHPEVVALALADEYGDARWSYPANALEPLHLVSAALEPIQRSVRLGIPATTPVFDYPGVGPVVAFAHPILRGNRTTGAFVCVVSLKQLLQSHVPWGVARRYQIGLIGLDGDTVASRLDQPLPASALSHTVAFDPPGNGLALRATAYQTRWPLWQTVLYWLLGGLSLLMIWSLWVLRRHMRQRLVAERALLRETRFRRAMEDSLVSGMVALDLDGCIRYVNRAFCQMVGMEADELMGRSTPMPYWPPECVDACRHVFDAIQRGEAPLNGFSTRYMRRNGERFDVRLYASALIDDAGRHAGWMASLYDVTELKREREALKASHERFVAVLDGLDAAVTVTDRDSGELLMSNRTFRDTFGFPDADGAVCALPLKQDGQEAEIHDPVNHRWYQVRRRESIWVDQSRVWLDIATDVTERKLAAERERQQDERLQHTARLVAMGEMASSLAHELNQPLAAISSYSTACRNLLRQPDVPIDHLDEALARLSQQAQRAGEIVRGIRTFVQRREPRREPCTLDNLLDSVTSLLAAQLRKHEVRLLQHRASGLPAIEGDRVMLEQVLFNLIKNALEAMADLPRKQRELTLETGCQGEQLFVVVADRGRGIAPEEAEKLFLPFYTTKAEGMGMGLNICRTVIEQHLGRLWVEPNPGGGARFVVHLPCPKIVREDLPDDTFRTPHRHR